ncbi:integrase arm-type DNA-binding domain-containing protein [Asticcacaulis sp. AC402]|uniref:tyrosine-type recombinase/integrase n=1 Tax=Asticcacaulis sp. AC402 TaxID=1282361 RepID=UPI0003C3F0F9|nr:integrase arm-type DNA-binding domain-containing protein [Asticcacaulis sp. AC402]ESQ73698.1 integrase [Asticcacaulis sp. AC402]
MTPVALSDVSIRSAKPQEKQYKLHDGAGLFVIVRPSGAKLWRLKYRMDGKEKQLSIGTYPLVGLKEARERRDDARKAIGSGIDPGAEKKRQAIARTLAAETTFEAIALEFLEKRKLEGVAPPTIAKSDWLLGLLLPRLGRRPLSEIEPYEILTILKEIEKKGRHESAGRARSLASRVFKFAIITGRAKSNPAADLSGALVAPRVKHHAAVIEPDKVGGLLRAIGGYNGHVTTGLALQLLAHVFVRPGELRHAEWSEFDFERKVWRIPAGRMKMRAEHAVPLSCQALAILEKASEVKEHSKYVFPAVRTWQRPMSENTLNAALRRMGYGHDEMTAHGFRSTASTLLNESGKWSPDAIERALSHKDANELRGVYHRGAHWQERVEMAQWWSDYLDALKRTG